MSKEHSIRIRNKDRELIKKLNARVYSKKSYLKKQDLFPDIETKGITQFESRKEFNQYVKEMERFTSRQTQFYKTDQGVTLPKGLLQNIEKEIKRINREKAKRKEIIEKSVVTFRGEATGTSIKEQLEQLSDTKFQALIPLKFNPNRYRNIKEMEEHLETIKEKHKKGFLKRKDTLYKNNYLQAISNVFGDTSELYKVVQRMPLAKFIHFYYTETLAHLKYVYDETLRNEIHDELVTLYKGE